MSNAHLAQGAGLFEGGPAGEAGQAEDMHAGDDHCLVPQIKYLAQACGRKENALLQPVFVIARGSSAVLSKKPSAELKFYMHSSTRYYTSSGDQQSGLTYGADRQAAFTVFITYQLHFRQRLLRQVQGLLCQAKEGVARSCCWLSKW